MKKLFLAVVCAFASIIVNAQDAQTKLYRAIEIDNVDSVTAALNAGANVNESFPQEGYFKNDGYNDLTPVMKAAWGNKLNVLKVLLAQKKVKVNAVTDQQANHSIVLKSIGQTQTLKVKGKTALHFAVYEGHFEAVKMLVDAGADPLLEMEVKFPSKVYRNGIYVKEATFAARKLAEEKGFTEMEEYLKKARNASLFKGFSGK